MFRPGKAVGGRSDPGVETGRRRVFAVGAVFLAAFSLVAYRLVDVMAMPSIVALASGRTVAQPNPGRVDIVDRRGELLATDIEMASVFADPARLSDPALAAQGLAGVLAGVDPVALEAQFRSRTRFVWVKRLVTEREQQDVLRLGLAGVDFRYDQHRVYPRGALASHVVGYVGLDNRGLAGIEYSLQDRLTAHDEGPVRLSLDLRLQQVLREELLTGIDRTKAAGANGVIMDIASGEVMAMVSLPDYDPNNYETADGEQRLNRNTGGTYEMGSVLKVLTTAMALQEGGLTLDSKLDARAPLRIGRYTIHDDHPKARWLSLAETFMYSSNIGTAKMALAMGGEEQQSFLRRAGMFERSDLELPDVALPQVQKRWSDITTATVSFGHGISITPMHMVTAVGSVVGDGRRVHPTLLAREPGEVEGSREQLVSQRVADHMRWLLWLVVHGGTGDQAAVDGYLVGGKTGTADKVNTKRRGYLTNSVIASFIAAFPMNQPRYVVLVMLDDPKATAATRNFRYAGWTAAPLAARVIERVGPILGVPPVSPVQEAAVRDHWKLPPKDEEAALLQEKRFAAVGTP